MRKILRITRIVAVNLVILFILLEMGSAGFYFFKTGEFFYTRSNQRVAATKAQFEHVSPNAVGGSDLHYQIHPYFGFNRRSAGVIDSPTRRGNKNQFIVGIFGGSVAQQFYFHELKHGTLALALKRLPQFQDKEIVLRMLSHEAYKQPQQLLKLNYLLSIGEDFDIVINLDGFNEVHLAYQNNLNGIHYSMPASFIVTPIIQLADSDLSPDQLDLALEIFSIKRRLKNSLDEMSACRIAVCYAVSWAETKYLFGQYQVKSNAFNAASHTGAKNSFVHLGRVAAPLSESELIEAATDEWMNASHQMNDMLSARGIQYFHFIQPNQYYATSRKFTDSERTIALSAESAFGRSVTLGYPRLLAKSESLRNSGVRIFSAVSIFDYIPEIVYKDNCCHYDEVGLKALSEFISSKVASQQTSSVSAENAP